MPRRSIPSPEQFETINPDIIERRNRLIQFALENYEMLEMPYGWQVDKQLSKRAGIPDPHWQKVKDPFKEDFLIDAAVMTETDNNEAKWLVLYTKIKDEAILKGLFNLIAPIPQLYLVPDYRALEETYWESEDAAKFMNLCEELLETYRVPSK
jgi:hypothetical protein